MTVYVVVGECMRLPEVGEWLRECIGILPWSTRMLTWMRGKVPGKGGANKRECLVHDIENIAFAKDMNALTG